MCTTEETLKNKHTHIVEQYKIDADRPFFNAYILGVIQAIIDELCPSNEEKVKCVAEVLQLVDSLKKEEQAS